MTKTRKRNDNHGTEFSDWLREQSILCSSKGFLATNLDFIWFNYKTKKWIMLEEKRHEAKVRQWQADIFLMLDDIARNDSNYRGFVFLQFRNKSPLDGFTNFYHRQNGEWIKPKLTLDAGQLVQKLHDILQ